MYFACFWPHILEMVKHSTYKICSLRFSRGFKILVLFSFIFRFVQPKPLSHPLALADFSICLYSLDDLRMPPKSFTPKKVVGKVSSSPPSTRRKSTSRTEIVDEGDSDNGDNETTENNRRSSRSARIAECASAALRTRSSRSSAAAKTESTASTSKDDGKRLTIQFGDSPDDSSDASVVSVGLSSDEEVVGSSSKKKNNSIPFCEVEKAAIDRLNNLSRYRKIFEPFVTPKVMAQLNNVLIEKQRRNQEGGVANSKGAAASTSAVGTEDTEDRFATERLPQPRCLSPICKMRDYQLEGFSWLVNNYHRSVNCILADEMGLGKTLQSIACVAHLALVKKLSGPYLFIVPLSVLFNWMNEFKKWCPALKVVRLHSNDKDEQLRLRKVLSNPDVAQIVVTTYDAVKTGGLHHALRCIVWRSVFLDEGHRIKNEDADVTRACHALRTRFRVILTGTPVQNNLHEFGALLSFLAPNIFTDLSLFDAAFKLNVRGPRKDSGRQSNNKNFSSKKKDAETVKEEQAAAQQIDRALLENAHYMMKPFVLRRLKSEVEQKLPPKYETKINCPMTEVQKELTRALLFKEQALISKLDSTITAPADQVAAAEKMEESGSGAAEMIGESLILIFS